MAPVSESLLTELTGGRVEPETRVADPAVLAERLGVRPSTARAAIDALVEAGYLVRRGAFGVYVASSAPSTSR